MVKKIDIKNGWLTSEILMDPPYAIIAGPASAELAEHLASELGSPLVRPDVTIFSDGESKIRLEGLGLQGRNCIVVQSTYPPVDRHLIQLLLLAHGCHQQGADEIIAVVPYLGYARQDKAFQSGEITSIELVSRLMDSAGITQLITVDVHSLRALSHFSMKVGNVSAIPPLASFFQSIDLAHPIVVSPDSGGIERARLFGEVLGCDVMGLKKTRNRQTGDVTVEDYLEISPTERDVLLVDDMISSGYSIAKASEILRKNGARKIYAICTHALMIDGAEMRLRASGVTDIITTNSIPNQYSKVDVAPILIDSLKSRLAPSRRD